MNLGMDGPVLPIIVAGAAIAAGVTFSRFVVPWILRKKRTFPPFHFDRLDAVPFLVGALVMFVSGLAAKGGEGSVWSYVVDTGSFLVGTSLFAIAKPRTWPRIVGLLIVGIHTVQVLVTNTNAPLYFIVENIRGAP